MAVSTDKPCINNTVLELADKAPIGYVLYYTDEEYQWVDPDTVEIPEAKWKLTKTDRGFEMIDENGRSRGIVNLGNPYSGINPTPACDDCGKDYIFQDAVLCIPQVCETGVFGNGDKGYKPEWFTKDTRPLPKPNVFNIGVGSWIEVGGKYERYINVMVAVSLYGENGMPDNEYLIKPNAIVAEVIVNGNVLAVIRDVQGSGDEGGWFVYDTLTETSDEANNDLPTYHIEAYAEYPQGNSETVSVGAA